MTATNNNRPIENRNGVEFDNYKFYMLSIVGYLDECILAAKNHGVNIYDWYQDPHHDEMWNLIGVLPSSAALDVWMARTDPNPQGGYPHGSLVIFWEMNQYTGMLIK